MAGAKPAIDHVHDEMEFDLVLRGSGSFVVGERSYALAPGTLICLAAGQRHRDRRPKPAASSEHKRRFSVQSEIHDTPLPAVTGLQ